MSRSVQILQYQLQRFPERSELYRDLVRLLLRRGRADEAADTVMEMEERVPGSPVARGLAKEVLAHRLHRAQLDATPGPKEDLGADLRHELDALWSERHLGDGSAVLPRLRELRRRCAGDRDATGAIHLVYAAVLEQRGQLQDALGAFNQAVEQSRKKPRIAHALLQKGRLLERIRYRDKAVAHYRQALRFEPGNMSAIGALLRAGADVDPELSDLWLEAVARLDGRSPFEALRDRTE